MPIRHFRESGNPDNAKLDLRLRGDDETCLFGSRSMRICLVNPGAIPETLMVSELFEHFKGALIGGNRKVSTGPFRAIRDLSLHKCI